MKQFNQSQFPKQQKVNDLFDRKTKCIIFYQFNKSPDIDPLSVN